MNIYRAMMLIAFRHFYNGINGILLQPIQNMYMICLHIGTLN